MTAGARFSIHMTRYLAVFQLLALAGVMAVAIPLALGFFGRWHPAFDSLTHFRAHLAVVMIVATPVLFFAAMRPQALFALVFGLSALSTTTTGGILPGLGSVQAAFAPRNDDQAIYRLLQMNLRFDNAEPGKVLSLVGSTQPDVMTFDEVSAMWAERLQPLFAAYPYHVLCPYPNGIFGVAILSRRPFAEGSEPHCADRGAFAVAKVDFGGRQADIAAIHLGWPWPFGQMQQIGRLTPSLTSLGETALLAGDLNATPWSNTVATVGTIAGAARVPLNGATWQHHRLPDMLRFAGLPIDHVFTRGGVMVHSIARLEPAGSDHLPVLVEFSLVDEKPVEPAATATVSLARINPQG